MLNFTRQERAVVVFLIVTLSLGGIIKTVKDRRDLKNARPDRFYKEAEQFKEITEQINGKAQGEIVSGPKMSANPREEDKDDSAGQIHGIININTATAQELDVLPGIGPAIANRIKAYRDQNGPFKNKADIILVKGIGEKLYDRIQGLVTTE